MNCGLTLGQSALLPCGLFLFLFVIAGPEPTVYSQELTEDAQAIPDPVAADETSVTDHALAEILQGHSFHGEAFNEGPRQKAYLMGGTGNIRFPVTTKSDLAQSFINQGVGQLHGFWDLEAERSFRQAAAIDEQCAMAYWGAAWAAGSNRKRARGFIETAMKYQQQVTERERMYIEALEKYLREEPDDKEKRAAQLLKDLESIVLAFPDDLEAKAFVAHRVWQNSREGVPIASYLGTDALLKQIYEDRTPASGPPLFDSPVGPPASRECLASRRPMRHSRAQYRSHVAYARAHLFSTETLRRRNLSAGGVGTRRSRPHDAGSDHA